MTDWLNAIHVGDCRALMRQMIADGVKVQCIVTSPPYWGLRDYQADGQYGAERTWIRHVARMRSVFRLCRELLAEDGVMFVNYGDSYSSHSGQRKPTDKAGIKQQSNVASSGAPSRMVGGLGAKQLIGMPWRVAFALQADGWILRQDIIWSKPNPMPESVRDRCTKAHEYMFLFAKNERYYWDFEAMQEPAVAREQQRFTSTAEQPKGKERAEAGGQNPTCQGGARTQKTPDGWDTSKGDGGHGSFHKEGREKGHLSRSGNLERKPPSARGVPADGNGDVAGSIPWEGSTRNRRSVWTVGTAPFKAAHFATFPRALIEPCILAGSRPGDIVFDPFMGSGTVAETASSLGRQFIGCELNPDYVALFRAHRSQQQGLGL